MSEAQRRPRILTGGGTGADVDLYLQKLAEHRAQREQQERELQALREAKFRQFEEWQRQQLTEDKKGSNDAARRVV